jgi:hypothetical protein
MFQAVIEKAMTEQGLKPVQIGGSQHDFLTSDKEFDDTWALKFGDQISIYMDTETGYAFMCANGIEGYNQR